MSSLAMKATLLLMKIAGKELGNTERFIKRIKERTSIQPDPPPSSLKKLCYVDTQVLHGCDLITVRPKKGGQRWHVIYAPGGAYVSPAIWAHWGIVEQLVRATGATVTMAHYPLAPELDNRAGLSFLTAVYEWLLEKMSPKEIIFCGDSAGAGALLGVALQCRDRGLPKPARLVLFAPWLDLTLADPEMKVIEPSDPDLCIETLRICGKWWAGADDSSAPHLSPINADLSGLPHIDLFVGDIDLFVVDARRFVSRVRESRGSIDYVECSGAFHVYMAATWTPEAKAVYRVLAQRLV